MGGERLMPRIRSIKPEFFASEDVSVLPLRARLTWIGLWTQCDDHGRAKDNVKLIKANLWVLDDVSLRDVEDDLIALAKAGRIVRYTVDGQRFLAVQNWHHHQSINRPGRPKYPAPHAPIMAPEPGENGHCPNCWAALQAHGALSESSLPVDNPSMGESPGQSHHGTFSESSVNGHGGLTPGKEGNREGKGGERASAREQPPPSRCPQHLNEPTDRPCRACGDARRARETWDSEVGRRDAERRSTEARQLAEQRASAIAGCELCDERGYRGRVVCDHDPDRLRRAEARRSAMRQPKAPAGNRP